MNESLLGCFVWTVFTAVFLGLDRVLRLAFPASGALAPFPALLLMFIVWLAAMIASGTSANRGEK